MPNCCSDGGDKDAILNMGWHLQIALDRDHLHDLR